MTVELENKHHRENGIKLTENEIFEKIKKDLNPIQENLVSKRITVEEAKFELKKINEWLQGTKLEKKDKKNLRDAFNKLEENIDENNLKSEFSEIVKLLERTTQKDLSNLNGKIQQTKQGQNSERLSEAQDGVDMASNNFEKTVHEASKDQNIIARKVGELMEKLIA